MHLRSRCGSRGSSRACLISIALLAVGCSSSDPAPPEAGAPSDASDGRAPLTDGGVDADPPADHGGGRDSARPFNPHGGVRELQLELAPAARQKLLSGALKRGDKISAIVSFRAGPADAAKTAAVEIYPMDAVLEGGKPIVDSSDSLAAGAIRLPLTIETLAHARRIEVPFTFSGTGRDGLALNARLVWPGETHGAATLSFAIDEAGRLTASSIADARRASFARLLADPAALTKVIGASKTIAFAKKEFEKRYFGIADAQPIEIYPTECSQPGMFCISGRLAFDDPSACAAPVTSQQVTWNDCHALKRHFAAGGAPITAQAKLPEALRPLAATVKISLVDELPMPGGAQPLVCGTDTVQTTPSGYFLAKVKACGRPGSNARVIARITPVFRMPESAGTIRTIWPTIDAATVVVAGQSVEIGTSVYTDQNETPPVVYSHPTLVLDHELPAGEPPSTGGAVQLIALGTKVMLPAAAGDSFNYVREAWSAHQTVVELHLRLQQRLGGSALSYESIFGTTPWDRGYTVVLGTDWPNGGLGYMALLRPQDNAQVQRLLSHTDLLAHEFGHSIHASFAPQTLQKDYTFANMMTRGDGEDYTWGHGGGQYQELGVALIEGLASGVGQLLLNGCDGPVAGHRPQGGAVPFADNMWNGDDACDADDGCPSHHFRWQMKQRGVTEGSSTWTRRLGLLQSATDYSVQAGHAQVTSNSETRVAELFCDLLDSVDDVSHASQIDKMPYVADFTAMVGQILDGAFDDLLFTPVSLPLREYQAPAAESVQLSLPQLLEAAGSFCGQGCLLPQAFGPDYTAKRLATTTGMLSPQRLVRYLVDLKRITAAQGANVLRTNLMEDQL